MAGESPATPPAQGDSDVREGTPKERRVVRMGKYEVIQHIATGGMGAVYRARDTETGRDVAIKVMSAEMAQKPSMLERFRRESRAASKLDHENLVSVYEFGECTGLYYLAMEYVDGVDLHDHVKKNGPLDPEDARLIILQGARALRHAHENGVVHRDVKPSNFLMTLKYGRPRVKLTDFGLAREVNDDEFRVTRAGTTVGTIDYMSPEQARDSGQADVRSDLYSLGCTWYFLLTGQPPFPLGGLGERLIKIMHDEPTDIRDVNPFVSGDCWRVIEKLLRKEPNARYQTPGELIDVLLALEGRTVARPGELREPKAVKKKPKSPSTALTEPVAEPTEPDASLWPTLAGLAAVLVIGGGLLIAVTMPRGKPDTSAPPSMGSLPSESVVIKQERILGTPPPQDKGVSNPVASPPASKALPSLMASSRAVNVAALKEEILAPWANSGPVPADAVTVTVSRGAKPSPTSFRSLAEACKAGEPSKALVVEIRDNGPLFELPLGQFEGRDLVVRAAKGYRPLVLWDLTAASRTPRKADDPFSFLRVTKGRLFLEGLEIALRWPETAGHSASLFGIEDGDLTVTDCTISAAGKPRQGLTLARVRTARESARVRFTRCQMRGSALTALDLDAPGAEVLFEGCLVVGAEQPLLRVKAGRSAARFRVVRSTMLGGPTLVELRPEAGERLPAFSWMGWDSLLSQSRSVIAGKEATLLSVLDGAQTRNVTWRAVNCLYAGWKNLLGGATTIPADAAAWQGHWPGSNSDAVAVNAWPEQAYTEPAMLPASAYQPTGPVLFRATVAEDKPLGCDLPALPASRDGWLTLALDPALLAPDLPSDDSPPALPLLTDGKYHGGTIDLTTQDVGAFLARLQEDKQLGPRVVLHLSGKGEHLTSPIRLKDTSLVLHFPEPGVRGRNAPDATEKDAPRLTLTLARTTKPVPLIDLDGGSLDVVGGALRVPDQASFLASHVVRVKGGDVRMYRTHIEGPQSSEPEGYSAALELVGSGDPAPDKGRSCALNECVVLSSRAGVLLDGVGGRLSMRQCLVVSAREALYFKPGTGCKGRAGMLAQLTNVTFAARRAVVRLGDASAAGVPTDPVVVQARECAYLNPFPGRPSKAGMVAWEGDALPRGLLLWQGEREGYDARLHYSTAAATGSVGDIKEGVNPWKQLWGAGLREPREVAPLLVFDARRWQLDRLVIKMRDAPGANLDRLGVLPRKPMSR